MRSIFVLALALSFCAATGGRADAHAMLRKAAPAVGSTLAAAPREVTLDFSEALEPRFTTVVVQDAQGNPVDAGDKHLADGNARRLIVGLKSLPAGSYKVIWHATSVDTHKSEGAFEFSVRP
jgi:methionine-rich copper-binding protein CopC